MLGFQKDLFIFLAIIVLMILCQTIYGFISPMEMFPAGYFLRLELDYYFHALSDL